MIKYKIQHPITQKEKMREREVESKRFIRLKLWLKWHCRPHTDHNLSLVDDPQGNLFLHWQRYEKFVPIRNSNKKKLINFALKILIK